tara:strand:- start:8675 stop:9910 length:1236 start_codon:yes stop_codon:yes gene_type:complete
MVMHAQYIQPNEEEQKDLARILLSSFASDGEDVTFQWLKRCGVENLRVLRTQEHVLGGLVRYNMGQFFGGQSVPNVGLGGVCISPEARGKGYATQLMTRALQEFYEEGYALSTLYGSSQRLYRGVGYDLSGHAFSIDMPLQMLTQLKASEEVLQAAKETHIRRGTRDDVPALKALHAQYAPKHNGHLDRCESIWLRILRREEKLQEFVFLEENGQTTGALTYQVCSAPHKRHDYVKVRDFIALTPVAHVGLMKFLAGFRTMADRLVRYGGPTDPFITHIAEYLGSQSQIIKAQGDDYWMMRVVNVKQALETRGYQEGIEVSIPMHIDDPIIAENTGDWRLDIKAGRGHMHKLSTPTEESLSLSIEALAPLYTGFQSAHQLKQTGLLRGPDKSISRATLAFSGPPPSLPDDF